MALTTGAGTSRLFQPDVRLSLRIGPPVFGSGLLGRRFLEADILAAQDFR
ncbi:MAG: di-heme oxidoredictase family protein [Burkholderiaceae bacterium]